MTDDSTRLISHTEEPTRHPWPEDVFIQGGGNGVVFGGDAPSYRTAFVEAFPKDPPTFLRGEGETIANAEDDCWLKYRQYVTCPHGEYERREYRNGSGYCVKCGLWMNKVFEPLPEEPRPASERSMIERLFIDEDPKALITVLDAMTHAEELPTKAEATASDTTESQEEQ